MAEETNIHEAKTHLSRLLKRVQAGEEVVIAKAGKPVAKLVPIQSQRQREPGRLRGEIEIADDFDAPLPQDLIEAFEGG